MFFEYNTPEKLLDYMKDFDYKQFDFLMEPTEVYYIGEGSCHDQVLFELDMLLLMGIKPKAKFLMAVDKDNIGGETHTFAYWVDATGAYWFENAWEDYRGIHQFSSEQELLDTVVSYFKERNPYQYIFLADFNPGDHAPGEDLDTFVDTCMENAALV